MWRGLLAEHPEDADVAVFGIAVDGNCSVGTGAAWAPEKIRECSEYLPPVTVAGNVICNTLIDLGDVTEYDALQVLEKMKTCNGKKFVFLLGGDHSVSILSQKAYRQLRAGKRGIIHIDAHADICDYYNGSHYSHACVNKRALENGYSTEDITMIGIRSYEVQEVDFLRENPVDIYSADEVKRVGAHTILEQLYQKYADYEGIYLSFDIDAVDPAQAPGTGTPEAFGLSSETVRQLLEGIVANLPVDMMDIVEVSPPLDCNNITTWLALKYILEILHIVNNK